MLPAPLSPEYLCVFRRAAALLTSSSELEHALSNTIATCLPALGDFGFFDVIIERAVRRTAMAHEDAELDAFLKQTQWTSQERQDINLCALCSNQPVLHPDTNDQWYAEAFPGVPRKLAFRSMISVPVRSGEELIGSLTLFMGSSSRNHTQADLDFAAELAGLAAPVVVNARLLEQQRQSQTALQLSEERLRVATDAGKIGIWDWDITADKFNWSDRVYELHGRAPGTFDGSWADYIQLLHPDDRQQAQQKIQAAILSGESFSSEFRSLWPDGSSHWISTWAHIYRDTSGNAVRMVGSAIDITAQKNAVVGLSSRNAQLERQVVHSESERDRIWRMSQDILAVASLKGHVVSVSPALTHILGWSEANALATPFIKFVHPDQRDEVAEKLAHLAQGVAQEGLEIRCLHKEGGTRWISWTIVPEGELLFAVGRDITELRGQREELLNASEKRLQLALEVGGMGAWQWDIRHNKVTWWPGMDKLHGLPPGSRLENIGDYIKFVHPDDLPIIRNSLQTAALTGNNKPGIEYRVVWPDGSVRWLEGRSEVFFDAQGVAVQRAGVCMDVTQRKLTEQNLRFLAQASSALAELVDHEVTLKKVASLAVPTFADWCTVDLLDGAGELKRLAVTHVDPAKIALAYELHNRYPPSPHNGRGAWEIMRSGKTELVPVITDDMLSTAVTDTEYLNILRELGLRSYIGVPLAVHGKTLGVLTFTSAESNRSYTAEDAALAEDIGRRAAIAIENSTLYHTLKAADRRKDDFLAMLAHELRNPLAPIAAAAEILKLNKQEVSLQKTSEVISRQVDHMTELVDDLLDVSRVTQGKVVIETQPMDIKQAVYAAVEQARPLINKRHHQLSLDLPTDALLVEGDEKRLVQIFANLLNNAAKYTPESGSINLTITATATQLEITVSDNGIGMTPDLVNSAFDLFVQGKRASDRAQGGLGLGLALVKSLVELHKGRIQAYSKGPGMGSKFVMHLQRLNQTPINPQQSPEPMKTSTRSNRILIVDDNADAADMLVLFLTMVGQDASVVYHPLQALEKVEQESFDTILLDIGLPGMDGYELARRLRARLGPHTPVLIAISGYGQEQDRDTAIQAGIDHYLVKPVDTDTLVKLLGELHAP